VTSRRQSAKGIHDMCVHSSAEALEQPPGTREHRMAQIEAEASTLEITGPRWAADSSVTGKAVPD
jgi:hypothetical protein